MDTAFETWKITIPSLKDTLIARKKFKPDPVPTPQPESERQPQTPEPKRAKKIKEDAECEQDTPCCTTCRYVKSKTCGSDQPGLRCKRPPPEVIPSVASLTHSVRANCRYCCCTLCEFFKEAYKTTQGDPKSKVCDILAEISDILIAIANDCVLFMRRISCTAGSAVVDASHKYAAIASDKVKVKVYENKLYIKLNQKLGHHGLFKIPTAYIRDENMKSRSGEEDAKLKGKDVGDTSKDNDRRATSRNRYESIMSKIKDDGGTSKGKVEGFLSKFTNDNATSGDNGAGSKPLKKKDEAFLSKFKTEGKNEDSKSKNKEKDAKSRSENDGKTDNPTTADKFREFFNRSNRHLCSI